MFCGFSVKKQRIRGEKSDSFTVFLWLSLSKIVLGHGSFSLVRLWIVGERRWKGFCALHVCLGEEKGDKKLRSVLAVPCEIFLPAA